jgi:phosphate:Na+ symporter
MDSDQLRCQNLLLPEIVLNMKALSILLTSVLILAQPGGLNAQTEPSGFGSHQKSVITEDVFKTVFGNGKEEAAEIHWTMDYDYAEVVHDKQVIIKYITDIGAKRAEKGLSADWKYTEPIPATDISYTINDLKGNEKYVFYVGMPVNGIVPVIGGSKGDIVWSDKVKVKTARGWGLAKMLILLGSLGLFIFGMKIMSDGLQRASSKKLRQMLGSITANRVKGVITGFFSTAIVQSSSVTTVMTVSLVNAGLLNLRQSAGVMMGANIGTTITAWLVLLLGFKVSISSYALMLIALGAPLLFLSIPKAKDLANSIIGFAILFIGLQFLKDAVPDLGKDSAIVQFFVNYKDIPVVSNLMFVALGALVTIVIQSSSAAMALTLTMVSKGIIPFEVACAMVLGENIGTTITAELASTIGNVHAKRSARIHSMFNIVGVTWMLFIFPFFLDLVGYLVAGSGFDPANPDMANSGIAMFHTSFNLANVLIMIWFVPQLVRLAERTVPSKGDLDEEFKLNHIGAGVLAGPGLGILEAKKEVARFGEITARMSDFIGILLNEKDKKKRKKAYKKLAKYEEITDRFEVEIAQFLEKVAQSEMTEENSVEVRSMLSIANDLERIGDIFFQMSKSFERKEENKVYFDPGQRERLNKMLGLLKHAFNVMQENLNAEYGKITLDKAKDAEHDLNRYRNELRRGYHEKIAEGDKNIQGSMVYNDIFSQCEKVGDHIINVSEAVEGSI